MKSKEFFSEFGPVLPDVFALQEIFHIPENFDLDFPGYTFFSRQRKLSRGGGVGFLVKNELIVDEIDSPFVEGLFESILLKVRTDKKTFIVGNFYRPPKGDLCSFNSLYSEFLEMINDLSLTSFVFCDSNLNLLKKDAHQIDFFNNNIAFGFVNFINNATRVIPPALSGIDQIFTNVPSKVLNAGIITDSPSDHFFTFLIINETSVRDNHTQFSRNFSRGNVEQFCFALESNGNFIL